MPKITQEELDKILEKASPWGSVEIIIQAGEITQISYKHIEKFQMDKSTAEATSLKLRNKLDVDKFGHIIKRAK